MLVLRQSTSIDIRMGPFVDSTDGVTPETGVTLAGADQAEVLKANGAAATAMAGTFAAVTGAGGWYDYTVATGDVDTVGEVVFVVQDSSLCLPVLVRAQVVEETVFDALFAASAAGFASVSALATVDANVDSILVDTATTIPAQITALNDFNPATDAVANVTLVATTTTNTDMRGTDGANTATPPTSAAISDAVWDELLSGHSVSGSTGEALSSAGTAGDPWTTALPGAYGAGTAGNIIGNNIDAPISTVDTNVDAILVDTGTTIPDQISGLNNLSAAQVNAECDTALADYDGPTNTEMEARTLPSASYFDPASDTVANVTTVGTTTTNTDMRGTDSAATATALATAQSDLDIITGATGVNLLTATQASIDAIELDTGTTLPGLINDLAIKKNAAFSNFEFLMVLTSDHYTPATGLTVTAQRSIDGGAFAPVSGAIAEVSNGIYQFDALAADTNGDVITWRFSSATADDTFITFKTVQ